MLLYAVSWLLLSLNGFDLLSTFTALSACINNIGPGLGMVGPTETSPPLRRGPSCC